MMEVRAYLKGARLSPQKACLVADLVRGKDVDKALDILNFSKQKGASLIKKLLNSLASCFRGVDLGQTSKISFLTLYSTP